MSSTQDIGQTTVSDGAVGELVPVYVQTGGAGTTILVNSGDTVTVYGGVDSSAPVLASLTATQSQTFTQPVWISSNSESNVTFTGPGY